MDRVRFVLVAGYYHTWRVSQNTLKEMRAQRPAVTARSSEYTRTTTAPFQRKNGHQNAQRSVSR